MLSHEAHPRGGCETNYATAPNTPCKMRKLANYGYTYAGNSPAIVWLSAVTFEKSIFAKENVGATITDTVKLMETAPAAARAPEKSNEIASQLSRDLTTLAPFNVR